MKTKKLLLFVGFIIFTGGFVFSQEYDYVGVARCKMCHNKPATGEQYKKWLEGPHSKSLESLKSAESLAYAKEHGIADPSTDQKCLKCHSTYAAIDQGRNAGVKENEGVSCESCHGAGKGYMNMTIMKSREKSIAKGLIVPTEETCKQCHNKENPFYKPFNFAEFSKKIAHPNPAANK